MGPPGWRPPTDAARTRPRGASLRERAPGPERARGARAPPSPSPPPRRARRGTRGRARAAFASPASRVASRAFASRADRSSKSRTTMARSRAFPRGGVGIPSHHPRRAGFRFPDFARGIVGGLVVSDRRFRSRSRASDPRGPTLGRKSRNSPAGSPRKKETRRVLWFARRDRGRAAGRRSPERLTRHRGIDSTRCVASHRSAIDRVVRTKRMNDSRSAGD